MWKLSNLFLISNGVYVWWKGGHADKSNSRGVRPRKKRVISTMLKRGRAPERTLLPVVGNSAENCGLKSSHKVPSSEHARGQEVLSANFPLHRQHTY